MRERNAGSSDSACLVLEVFTNENFSIVDTSNDRVNAGIGNVNGHFNPEEFNSERKEGCMGTCADVQAQIVSHRIWDSA